MKCALLVETAWRLETAFVDSAMLDLNLFFFLNSSTNSFFMLVWNSDVTIVRRGEDKGVDLLQETIFMVCQIT